MGARSPGNLSISDSRNRYAVHCLTLFQQLGDFAPIYIYQGQGSKVLGSRKRFVPKILVASAYSSWQYIFKYYLGIHCQVL